MTARLLNSAVMPVEGHYRLSRLSAGEFADQIRKLKPISYIGYPATAAILAALCGEEIPVSRDQTIVEDGDVLLIARLKYRVAQPGQKGSLDPTAEDFEFFRCDYRSES